MLIASKSGIEILSLRTKLNSEFKMKSGDDSKIRGMDISRNIKFSTLCVSQISYLEKVLKRCWMLNSKPMMLNA